ncbi:MAG: hypothetical protein GC168_15050 [Candidatus Hydrogenedens sp.]|nr:hypothetical protein [Candidatus Hydrogenedens sp.]
MQSLKLTRQDTWQATARLNKCFLIKTINALSVAGMLVTLLSGCPQNAAAPGRVGTPTCLACHDGRSAPDKREFLDGVHAAIDCEDCHGPGLGHVRAGGRGGLLIANPGESPFGHTPALCSQCHEAEVAGHALTAHAGAKAASCNTCHDVHKTGAMPFSTPNKTPLGNAGYQKLCGECHETQTEQFALSVHATSNVATCAACHNPHLETTFTAPPENNQLCQQCHGGFFLGLDTEEAVDIHTGDFHPVDPAGTGASRCVSCHMVPLRANNQARSPHDHTFNTVAPSDTAAMIAAGLAPHPNSCAGTLGCHDAGTPGSGEPFDLNSIADNETLQALYEQIGLIPEKEFQ